MKSLKFCMNRILTFYYHWTSKMINQHLSRWCLDAIRQQALTRSNVEPDICHHMVSSRPNELIKSRVFHYSCTLLFTSLAREQVGMINNVLCGNNYHWKFLSGLVLRHIELPVFSSQVTLLLDNNRCDDGMKLLLREAAAFYYLRYPNMKTSSSYEEIGKRLVKRWPCLSHDGASPSVSIDNSRPHNRS